MVYILCTIKDKTMIPEFNKYGNLPAGIYNTSIEEIGKKFGIESSQRKKLFKNLESLNKLLLKNKNVIKRFLIDGSFVTDVEFPEDIDCILIIKKNFPLLHLLQRKWKIAKRYLELIFYRLQKKNRININIGLIILVIHEIKK